MAVLDVRAGFGTSRVVIELVPQSDGDSSEYRLVLSAADRHTRFEATYPLRSDGDGHTDLWMLARCFAEAEAIAHGRAPVDLWRIGRNSVAYMYQPGDGLHAVLWGYPNAPYLAVRLFIAKPGLPQSFVTEFLHAGIQNAVKFGNELEDEVTASCPNWWASVRGGATAAQ